MDRNHTAGPWEVRTDAPNAYSAEVASRSVRGVLRAVARVPRPYQGDAKANARLIAAAPDMLSALQNLENDNGAIPAHAWELVQAAIRKATSA